MMRMGGYGFEDLDSGVCSVWPLPTDWDIEWAQAATSLAPYLPTYLWYGYCVYGKRGSPTTAFLINIMKCLEHVVLALQLEITTLQLIIRTYH